MSQQMPAPRTSNAFEQIKRLNSSGAEFWSARELARVLEYSDFRNFAAVIVKAQQACSRSGHAVADQFVDITEMVGIGSGAQRPIEDWALSRYACYLLIQNADPSKPLVALGQNYFAVQTRRQELADEEALQENQKRLLLRAEMKKHNKNLAGVAKQAGVRDNARWQEIPDAVLRYHLCRLPGQIAPSRTRMPTLGAARCSRCATFEDTMRGLSGGR